MDEVNLADIPNEGDVIEEKETSIESPAEKKPEEKPEEKKEKEEKKEAKEVKEEVPFHKHPRFKALVEEKNQYKKDLDDMKEYMKSEISEIKESQSKDTKIPKWFSEALGDNKEAWNSFQEMNKESQESIKKEIREDLKKEQGKSDDSADKWKKWVDNQIDSLQADGLEFKKEDLMKVMMEYKPTDGKGNLDFKKGYNILKLSTKKDSKKINERKKIVSESKKTDKEPQTKKWFTPADMVGKGW